MRIGASDTEGYVPDRPNVGVLCAPTFDPERVRDWLDESNIGDASSGQDLAIRPQARELAPGEQLNCAMIAP